MTEYLPDSSALRPEQGRPVGLNLRLPEQSLHIQWADGAASEFPLGYLRRHCPCATCRAEREKQQASPLLPILPARPGGELRVVGGEIVGNYALRLEWSDGHNTGIYDFRLLRLLHEGSPQQDG